MSNHPHYLSYPNSFSDIFFMRTTVLWKEKLPRRYFTKRYNENLFITIYPPYPQNLHFSLLPLTFISRTSCCIPLLWLAFEFWTRGTLVNKKKSILPNKILMFGYLFWFLEDGRTKIFSVNRGDNIEKRKNFESLSLVYPTVLLDNHGIVVTEMLMKMFNRTALF